MQHKVGVTRAIPQRTEPFAAGVLGSGAVRNEPLAGPLQTLGHKHGGPAGPMCHSPGMAMPFSSVTVSPGSHGLLPFLASQSPINRTRGGSPINRGGTGTIPAGGLGANFVASDVDGKLMELHEATVREMRDRMSADKDLRESMQQNQDAVSSIASRIDELLFDLRSEVPRLRQENSDLATELNNVKNHIAHNSKQIADHEQSLTIERDARQQAERTAHQQMLELLKSQENRVDSGMSSMHTVQQKTHERLCHIQEGLEIMGGRLQKLEQKCEHDSLLGNQRDQSLANDVVELRQRLDQDFHNVSGQIAHCSGLIDRVDKKADILTPNIQKWAEEAFIKRVSALEENLRLEVQERSLALQRMGQAISSGHAQVQTIKSKIDENDLRMATTDLVSNTGTSIFTPRIGGSLLMQPGSTAVDVSRRSSKPTSTVTTGLGSPTSTSLTGDRGRPGSAITSTSRSLSAEVPRGGMYHNTRHTLPASYVQRSSIVHPPPSGTVARVHPN